MPQRIQSDLNLVLNAVENFTSNAVKYACDVSQVALRVTALPSQRIRIAVSNDAGEKHAELQERSGTDALLPLLSLSYGSASPYPYLSPYGRAPTNSRQVWYRRLLPL